MIHELFMQMTETVAQYTEHGILGLGNVACGKHISDTTLKTDDVKQNRLISPFSASGINRLTCSGVPANATDTLGLLTSQYSLSLRRLKLTNSW